MRPIYPVLLLTSLLTACQTTPKRPSPAPLPVPAAPTPTSSAPVVVVPTTSPIVATEANAKTTPVSTTQPIPPSFNINGKLGFNSPKGGGSALYTWVQSGVRFDIELTAPFGMGQTQIHYDGTSATLTDGKRTRQADSPEALLRRMLGFQAPISQLPFWMMGQPAPSDNAAERDAQNRLTRATNGDWQAAFDYATQNVAPNTLPSRLVLTHPAGYKVVMTINH